MAISGSGSGAGASAPPGAAGSDSSSAAQLLRLTASVPRRRRRHVLMWRTPSGRCREAACVPKGSAQSTRRPSRPADSSWRPQRLQVSEVTSLLRARRQEGFKGAQQTQQGWPAPAAAHVGGVTPLLCPAVHSKARQGVGLRVEVRGGTDRVEPLGRRRGWLAGGRAGEKALLAAGAE